MAKIISMAGPEGNVYSCSWAPQRSGFRLWVETDVRLEVWGKDFELACDELSELISEILHDGEAVLEFQPAPPFGAIGKSWLKPAYVGLEYSETVSCSPDFATEAEPFRCPRCRLLKRDLLAGAVEIASEPRRHFSGVSMFHSNSRILSSDLVALLKSEGVSFPTLREVCSQVRLTRRYFEPDVRTLHCIQGVAFPGASYVFIGNQQCPACGYYQLMPTHPTLGTERFFVARQDVNLKELKSFFVRRDNFRTPTLAISREIWSRIRKNPITKGIVPASVAFVPKGLVVRHPPLPLLEAAT